MWMEVYQYGRYRIKRLFFENVCVKFLINPRFTHANLDVVEAIGLERFDFAPI